MSRGPRARPVHGTPVAAHLRCCSQALGRGADVAGAMAEALQLPAGSCPEAPDLGTDLGTKCAEVGPGGECASAGASEGAARLLRGRVQVVGR